MSRGLRVFLILLALAVLLIAVLALAYALLPAMVQSDRLLLQPTVFAPPGVVP